MRDADIRQYLPWGRKDISVISVPFFFSRPDLKISRPTLQISKQLSVYSSLVNYFLERRFVDTGWMGMAYHINPLVFGGEISVFGT